MSLVNYDDRFDLPPIDYDQSKVPQNIKERADGVREAVFGTQNKEFIAQAVEIAGLTAREAEQIAENNRLRQENLESETAQSVAQMEADKDAVIANATVDSEVILARGDKPTLQARLDETTAQLAQKALQTELQETQRNLSANHAGANAILHNTLSALSYDSKVKAPLTIPTPTTVMVGGIGANTYFPTTVKYNNELWCAIRVATDHGESFDGNIVVRKSTDGGVTWQFVITFDTAKDLRDPTLIVAPNGNLILRYFASTSTWGDTRTYIMIYNGSTWSAEIEMPKLIGYNALSRGSMTIKDGVIYSANYNENGVVYIVKSADSGASWQLGKIISNDWKINETSLCYNSSERKIYFVARQHIYKDEVLPYKDYENYMVMGESLDGDNWSNIREIPLYGHAPTLKVFDSDKMILSYKNTNRKNKSGNYQLDFVVLKNGEIFSQAITLADSPHFDAFYSDFAVLNSKVYFIYHDLNTRHIKCIALSFDEVNMLTQFSHQHIPEGVNENNGFLSLGVSFNLIFQSVDMPIITINAGETHTLLITLHKPFATRGYGVEAYLYRPEGDLAVLNSVFINARMLDRTTVSVTFHNVSGSSIPLDSGVKLKINAFGG